MPQEITQQEIKLSDESIAKLALVLSQNTGRIDKKYLTVKEAANYLRTSDRNLRGLMKQNKVPFYRLEGKILFKISELDDMLEKNKKKSLDEIIQRATNRGR
jgi:excisionase family DNA binding protein